jgi:hypothetical protein
MTIAIQIFAILSVICLPMISIAALVLTLAALNMSLGIRRIYVKILSFFFVYATKIKKDKEISIDSELTSTPPQIEPINAEKSSDESIELSPDISNQNSRRTSLQNDIQFKLSKNSITRKKENLVYFR